MEMNNQEIVKRYKDNPGIKQIGILADLNGCSRIEIYEVLHDAGLEIKQPGRPPKEPKAEKPKSTIKSCSEPISKDALNDMDIKVSLDEQKIEVCNPQPVPKYLIPESVRRMTQDRIDACVRLIITHTETIDALNREKLELENFLKGDFKEYGQKIELHREV